MSSCLSGGGRTYGFDLDIVKSPSPSTRSSHSSSSPSSTLSESSNSPLTISTKRARTPRKRPNQNYNEAAALLSTIYPNLFSTKNLHKLYKHSRPFNSISDVSSDLLPPFPALAGAGFLIREQSAERKPEFRFEPKPAYPVESSSPKDLNPGSPGLLDEDFDAESLLDEEVEEGIDSIMGNLSMSNNDNNNNNGNNSDYNSHLNPYFRSLLGFGFRRKFELGFGFGSGNISRALRRTNDGDWWRGQTVAVRDIVGSEFKASPPPLSSEKKNKKKKKKVEKEEVKEPTTISPPPAGAATAQDDLKTGLGLKLNYEEVLNAWSDGASPFAAADGSPESSADFIARLAEIDLFPDTAGGGVREASVLRYKEKRRTRLYSKKIRYQVRKLNADRRPRMKASGRFVRRPSLLHQAIEEESQ